MGLVLGTMFGSIRTISEFDRRALSAGPNYVKPFEFANSVINAAAGQTAIWHGLTGVNSTISGGTTAGLEAVGYAAGLIAGGHAATLLAGGADELCFESFLGFARAGLLCGTGDGGGEERPVPFDARRNGFVLGEGAALLVLEPAAAAAERGAAVLAEVRGWGAAYDPSRGRDERSATAAMARAVGAALTAAAVGPGGDRLRGDLGQRQRRRRPARGRRGGRRPRPGGRGGAGDGDQVDGRRGPGRLRGAAGGGA